MSGQQPEADKFLLECGIVSDPEDKRTTIEIARAYGFMTTTAVAVETEIAEV